MDFAAKHNIITMDECIDKSLCHSSSGIIWLVYPILSLFGKTYFRIIANKFTAALQQINQISFVFFVIKSIIEDGPFF